MHLDMYVILETAQVIRIHLDWLKVLPSSSTSHLILEGEQFFVFVEGYGHLIDP